MYYCINIIHINFGLCIFHQYLSNYEKKSLNVIMKLYVIINLFIIGKIFPLF